MKELVADWLDSGRIISTDNFFTSSNLGRYLYARNTQLLGTIRANRVGLPREFVKEPLEVLVHLEVTQTLFRKEKYDFVIENLKLC